MKTYKQKHKHYLHRARMAAAAACAKHNDSLPYDLRKQAIGRANVICRKVYAMIEHDGVHLREVGWITDVNPFTRYVLR